MNNNIWIEVNLKNLALNLKAIRKKVGPTVKVMGVIKQNAYGHGIIAVARKLEKENIDFLGINSAEEALYLLTSKIKTPLLILSNTISYKNLSFLLQKKTRFTVMEESLLKNLNRIAKKQKRVALIHVKVDTGMSRLGLNYEQALSFIEKALTFKNIRIDGLYSHLSCAEKDFAYTSLQIRKFRNLLDTLHKKGIYIRFNHICNSAGLVNFKNAHLDMVRPGIILYGMKPDQNLAIELKPVLNLKTKIIHVKRIAKNSFVSYANTFRAKKDTLVGIICCGYAYGYPWNLSGKAQVLIKGKRCNVLGRICMDHMVVDLSCFSSANIGQTVTLIGKEGKEEIAARELAQKAKTIPYEITTRLSPFIKRIYSQSSP